MEHGFYGDYSGTPENPGHGSSEALGISDKYGEVWIFHVLTGPGNASAVWAAQRLADEHVTVIPNDFIIEGIDLEDKDHFMASSNVFSFAQEMGWWDPQKEPFSFKKVYSYDPVATGPRLFLDGRTWRVFDRFAPSLGYVQEKPHFPFSVPVDHPVEVNQVMDILRDHYEGTPYDMTKGPAAGPFGNPVRYSGAVPGGSGGWQRAISLHRTLFSFVLQTRGNLPDAVGGITWFGQSAPHGTVYVPFSGAQRTLPESYRQGKQSEFSFASAWWAFDFVNNWRTLRYDAISEDVNKKISRLQAEAIDRQARFAIELADGESIDLKILEHENNAFADHVIAEWWALAWRLVSKYSDGYITVGEKEGEMQSPGYPASWVTLTEFAKWPTVDQPTTNLREMHATTIENASSTSTLCIGIAIGVAATVLAMHVHQTLRRRGSYRRI